MPSLLQSLSETSFTQDIQLGNVEDRKEEVNKAP